jgi:hypothetical protein
MLALIRFSMRTLFPAHAGMPGVGECDLKPFLEQFWREAAPVMKLGLALSTILYILTPIFTVYIPLPLFLLPRGLRDKHADRASTSGIYLLRSATLLVTMVAGLAWGANAQVRRRFALEPLSPDPGTWREGP